MEIIKIDNTEIFLDDYGNGKGKITISNPYGYNFSQYWGSMGSSLKDFLNNINIGYFLNKLIPYNDKGDFCVKASVRNIRYYIKNEFKDDLPWYKYMELQKEFRQDLRDIEKFSYNEVDFVERCKYLANKSWSSMNGSIREDREFESIINSLLCEPWHYISYKDSDNYIFLSKLFPKLKREINGVHI